MFKYKTNHALLLNQSIISNRCINDLNCLNSVFRVICKVGTSDKRICWGLKFIAGTILIITTIVILNAGLKLLYPNIFGR